MRVLDEALLDNLCDLRKAVLSLLIQRFVERATPEDIDRLERFEDAMDAAEDEGSSAAIANDLFFEQIDDVAGNPEASDALNRTWPLIQPAARQFRPARPPRRVARAPGA